MRTILLTVMIAAPFFLMAGGAWEIHLKNGVDKYESRDYKGALEDFNKAIEVAPKEAKLYLHRGKTKVPNM